jgi:ubiquitin carboxyl-terminal hydrolase 5/13
MGMGFSENGCKRAMLATGGADVESTCTYIFSHMEDPGFNDPLPENAAAAAPSSSSSSAADEGLVQELVANLGMFSADHVRAVLAHNGNDGPRAADWLFSHMDSLDADVAALSSPAAEPAAPPPPENLSDGAGVYQLVGFISHVGANTTCGHYVCHVKVDGRWVICNDDKVALSKKTPLEKGFVYCYRRK